jgi:hypothetical protein
MHALLLAAATVPSDQIDWLNLSDPTNVVRAVGFVLPLLTALVTKKFASGGLKSVVTLVLSALIAVIGTLVTSDGHFAVNAFVNAFVNVFVPAIAAYYGLWKATGVAGKVANVTDSFGLGRPVLETSDKGAESAGDYLHGDTGESGLGILGWVLVGLGAGLLILTALKVIAVSVLLALAVLILGVVLVVLARGTGRTAH